MKFIIQTRNSLSPNPFWTHREFISLISAKLFIAAFYAKKFASCMYSDMHMNSCVCVCMCAALQHLSLYTANRVASTPTLRTHTHTHTIALTHDSCPYGIRLALLSLSFSLSLSAFYNCLYCYSPCRLNRKNYCAKISLYIEEIHVISTWARRRFILISW